MSFVKRKSFIADKTPLRAGFFNSAGFSLVSTLVAAGIAGGIALVVAKLSGNLKDVEIRSSGTMDARETLSEIKTLLDNEQICKASLAGKKFFKTDVDEPDKDAGLKVTILKGTVKFEDGARAGRMILDSVRLFLDTGTGANYPDGPKSDLGSVRVKYHLDGDKKTLQRDYTINVDLVTTGGQSVITGCERSGVKTFCESLGMDYNPANQKCLNPKDECDQEWKVLAEEGTWFGWKSAECTDKKGGFVQSLILGQQKIAKTDSNSMKIKCCYSRLYEFVDCEMLDVAEESWWEGTKEGVCSKKPRGIIRKIEFYQGTTDAKDTNGMKIQCCYPN